MHPVLSGAVARFLSFFPTAVATLLASRVIIAHLGVPAFNGFTIAESLIVLLPLNGLGVGTAVTAAFASGDPLRPEAEAVTLTAARVMAVSALGLGVVSLAVTAGGLWPTLLGGASYGGWFFGLAMLCFAASLVPGLATGMLLGVHRNHVTVLVQTLITPAILVGVILLVVVKGDGRWVVVLPAAALALVNVVTGAVATRLTKFSWRNLLRKLPRPRLYPGGSIRGIAGPQLVLSLTVPLTLANDRVVLSHFASAKDVAAYGVCIQIFAPVTALVAAAAQPLWPIYVAAKASGSLGPRVSRTTLLFFGAAVAICAVLLPLCGPVGQLIGDGHVRLGLLLPVAAAVMTVVFAAAYPVGMILTSPAELRFIAIVSVFALPMNVVFSIVLARAVGAAGPLFATAAVGLAQFVAATYYLRTRLMVPAPPATGVNTADLEMTSAFGPQLGSPADIIYQRRVALLEHAERCGNVSEACRKAGVSRTRYYEWKKLADSYGIEALHPEARRRPQLPNATPTHVVEQLLSLALLEPTLGARRLADRLADQGWSIAASTAQKYLTEAGLGTQRARAARAALVGAAAGGVVTEATG